MGLLSKEQCLNGHELPWEDVPVPEWAPPGTDPAEAFVRVRRWTGRERDHYEASCAEDAHGVDNFRARLVALVAVDEEGKRLFAFEDAEALGRLDGVALERVAGAARRLCGLGKKEQEAAKKN